MNSLKYFDQINLENVAGALIDGKLWFVGKDAAKALKYPRVTKALKDHVDAEDMCEISFQNAKGRWVEATVINESGLFSLIFRVNCHLQKSSKDGLQKKFCHKSGKQVAITLHPMGMKTSLTTLNDS